MKNLMCLSALLCCPPFAVDAAEHRPVVSYQINKIEFKENGRIDNATLLECDLKKLIETAAEPYRAESQRTKQLEAHENQGSHVRFEIDLRVDKVAPIAARPPNQLGGTELGVSVFLTDQAAKSQVFLCRIAGTRSLVHPSRCSRLEYCSNHVAKQIADWLLVQPTPDSAVAK